MSETTTAPATPTTAAPPIPIHPSDLLISLIVALLAPMFLTSANGDISFARLAALETINAYRARTQVDLLAIAHVIAFGLGALGSLSLSMLDDLPPKLILRFRANAATLHRCAEQSRRALPEPQQPDVEFTPADAANEAVTIAQVADTQKRVAATQAAAETARPAPAPMPTAIAAPIPAAIAKSQPAPASDAAYQSAWAAAMNTVAAEFVADMAHLPPAERKQASRRAAILSSCAHQILTGTATQPLRPSAAGMVTPPTTG